MRHRPAATYRVQFRGAPAPGASPGTPTLLRFEEAARLVPYLEALGVTDLYASPPFTARTGSTHGYDVTDPLRLDPLLGPPDAFAALAGALRGRGMGLLLDIVPNHQAATPENPAWRDVLRRGRGSPFARWFDIDWQAADGRVVLPVLDDLYGHVLARGDLRVEPQDASWAVRYRDLVLPATLPPGTAPGEVHAVLEAQPYRLAWWGVAQEGLNYRRFFDIADLAGVRVEDPEVFAATHALVADLVARGLVTGLRVDHVDGLADPTGYLARLRALAPGAYLVVEKVLGPGERVPPAWPVAGTTGYELLNDLTALLADPSGVDAVLDRYHRFVASSGGTPPSAGGLDGPVEAALGRDAGASRGAHAHLDAVVRRSKVEAMRHLFHGEVEALVSRLARLAARDPVARDLGRRHLRRAVEEVTAALRIYRTYLRPGAVSPDDRAVVERAAALARGRLAVATRSGSASEGEVPEPPPCEAVTFFRRVLLEAGTLPEGARLEAQEVVRAWQQLTGPVMAKGVEDTALYRFGALLAFNEVGGDPSARSLPRSVEAFHARMAERARQSVEAGYTAVKVLVVPRTRPLDGVAVLRQAERLMAAIREAVGPEVDIMVDLHGRTTPEMAIQYAAVLAPYRPLFLEEPCLPENVDTLVTIARSTPIPIATGERLYTRWGFREVLEKQAAAIVQPDLCHAGGIFECRKIAAMAECYYAAVAPHNPLGPISLAACLQLDACTPNFLVQEQVSLGEGYLAQPFTVKDGWIDLPTGPGLGIELDEEALADKIGHDWQSPRWFHEDGSVADW